MPQTIKASKKKASGGIQEEDEEVKEAAVEASDNDDYISQQKVSNRGKINKSQRVQQQDENDLEKGDAIELEDI